MEGSDERWLHIKRSWILAVYLIVPISLGVVLLDQLALGGSWQPYLTLSLLQLPIYLAVFDMPHVVASLLTYADREYITAYRKQLLFKLPIVLAIFVGIAFWSYQVAVILFISYMMYHAVKQQTGIALVFTRAPGKLHNAWTYAGVVWGSLGYMIALLPSYLTYQQLQLVTYAMLVAFVVFLILSAAMFFKSTNRFAFWYVAAVSASLVASFICLVLNYLFLTVFIMRFIHDVTAFMFYITHDHNRNLEAKNNFLFTFGHKLMAPSYLLGPLLAMFVGFYLQTTIDEYFLGAILLMILGTAHYYLEGVMWKREAPHRQYVTIT